jgi:hypothetical protein
MTMHAIPRFCLLCGDHVAGMWRLPPDARWNVARVLLLCSRCAANEGAYCVHVDGMDDCEPSRPFVDVADLPALVAAGVCWCKARTLVPWCPAHGCNLADERMVQDER